MSTRAGAADETFWGDVTDDVALNRYRTLVNTIDDGMYQLDSDGYFVAVNEVITETTGYSREELLGEHVSLLLTDDDADRIEREIASQIETEDETIATFELGVQTADGGTVPCELRVNLLIEEGEFRGTIGIARDLSEKKQRLATLEEAQASYDSITSVLNEANIGVFVLNDEFEIAWANETIEQYFGLDRDELIGRDKRQVVHESIKDKIADSDRFVETVLATYDDNSYNEEVECHVTAGDDRKERWLEHWSKPIESGQYAGGRIELYYDVTDRRRSEDALRDTEERFQSLVDAVEEYAILRLDSDGHVISWNEGAKAIKGYDAGEILGEHFSTFYTEEDKAANVPKKNLEQATEAGSVEHEGWRVRKDGTQFWANVTITSIWDEDGTHRGFLKVTRDMTDRRKREQTLESELQRVFGRISDAFYAIDEDFRFTHVNKQAEELLQHSEDELLGEKLWDIFPSAGKIDEVRDAFQIALNEQEATSYELYYDTLDFWVEANLYPSETGISVYFRDITERKQRELELERYEKTIETIWDGVATLDADDRFVMVNEAFCEMTGYDRDELLGEHVTLVHDETVNERAEELKESVLSDEAEYASIEFDLETADGDTIPVEGRFGPYELEEGSVGRTGVTRDITERKEREQELQRKERQFEAVFNDPNILVGLLAPDGTTLDINQTAMEYIDANLEDVTGELFWETPWWGEGDGVQSDVKRWTERAASGEYVEFETDLTRPDGKQYTLNGVFRPVTNDDGEVVSIIVSDRDVTERREYERALEESNERLEQFAYAASHDLQEPLRMVTSYLQLVENRYADKLDEDGQEFIDFAVDGAERMRDMIDALLEYSRVETRGDPFEPVDLNDILEDVREDLQMQIEETEAEITTGDLPRVDGDSSQLRQVLQNLLSNAIEYSGDQPPRIDIDAEREGNNWIISVHDEGIGIDPDEQERIFEVFQRLQTHDEHPGTGIGLALCRRIVERHGGEIWVESESGGGATFSFTLPMMSD
ncbi:PAS domain S-box protein [Natrinema sp. 1APR25-10V2]|uniref:PAS domain-containing sensor histidine kinase n=1 Tax=Natrinema sp. 1APR25-10V2 TaxID=2951081 RepID=UPI0028740F57|nr:PAS domain S-box protein [Natrinema sp. 1APR25-10V2]MDS0473510.1 PAS domain S-box protein [Natrinema sp. 1APR25-10V2]